MTPREFLDRVVRPNVDDLTAQFGDIRRAANAIAALDALPARLFAWCRANAPQHVAGMADDDAYRRALRRRNRDFELVSDAAKAGKHVVLTRGKPSVDRADRVGPRSIGWDEGRWDDGRWDGPEQVVIEPVGDEPWGAEGVVLRALAFLEQEMAALGVP